MTYIQQSACRLLRALFELALKRGWASLTSRTLALCKMVEKRVWGSQSPLRQFNLIPEIIIRKLEKNSDIQWDRYYDLKSTDLGEMVKIPKMGKSLHKYVHMFPKMQLSALVQPITRILLKIDLTIVPDFQYDETIHGKSCLFYIIVEDNDGEKILHYESFSLKSQHSTLEHFVTCYVSICDPIPPQYFIKIVSDRWLHSETILPVSFRHLILPQKNAPPTDLLDLQPLPISVIQNRKLYSNFTVFNAIQTQTFSSLYQSDENVLVCAPTGSGKTVLAEFAFLRLFSTQSNGKCIYIAPKEVRTCPFNFFFEFQFLFSLFFSFFNFFLITHSIFLHILFVLLPHNTKKLSSVCNFFSLYFIHIYYSVRVKYACFYLYCIDHYKL